MDRHIKSTEFPQDGEKKKEKKKEMKEKKEGKKSISWKMIRDLPLEKRKFKQPNNNKIALILINGIKLKYSAGKKMSKQC